jgi:hypothetical protein
VPVYLSARTNAFREELEQIARIRKVKLNVAADIDSVSIRKEAALAGGALTILSGASIRREVQVEGIFAARITQPNLRRKICFVRAAENALSHAAESVASLVPETLADIVRHDMWPGAVMNQQGIPKLP